MTLSFRALLESRAFFCQDDFCDFIQWSHFSKLQICVDMWHINMVRIINREDTERHSEKEMTAVSILRTEGSSPEELHLTLDIYLCTSEGQSHNRCSQRKSSHTVSFPKEHDSSVMWADPSMENMRDPLADPPGRVTFGINTPSDHPQFPFQNKRFTQKWPCFNNYLLRVRLSDRLQTLTQHQINSVD